MSSNVRGPVDLTALLTDEHRAYMAGLSARVAPFAGFTMKRDDDDDDDDPDPDDDDPDDENLADPDAEIEINGKRMKVSRVRGIMAREKRQGRKAGQTAMLRDLGYESLDDLKAALADADNGGDDDDEDSRGKGKRGGGGDGGESDADRRARRQREREITDRERAAQQREERAAARERKADLRSALREAGVDDSDDLDDAYVLLDRAVDKEYEDDDLEDAVEELRERRPGLFEPGDDEGDDDEDDDRRPARRRPDSRKKRRETRTRGNLPSGSPPRQRNQPKGKGFGAGGHSRADARFGKQDK